MGIDTFWHKGQRWTRYPARPIDRFIVGVDLGQSADPTSSAVLQHPVRALPDQDWIVDKARHATKEPSIERFDVRHLERLPLGMAYPAQVQHVKDLLSRPPLSRADTTLVLDETGVG